MKNKRKKNYTSRIF